MLKIRLRRMGARNAPFYRVVVSDSRKTPTASAVENVGYYNPRTNPPEVAIDTERVAYWVGQGALVTPTVEKLVRRVAGPAAGAAGDSSAATAEAS